MYKREFFEEGRKMETALNLYQKEGDSEVTVIEFDLVDGDVFEFKKWMKKVIQTTFESLE